MMQWWVCKHGAPFDNKWKIIAARVGARPGDVWAVASALFDAASQAEPRGHIDGVDLEELAIGLGYDVEFVRRVYAEMQDRGVHDGQLVLNFEKHQPKGDPTAKERKQRQREKEAQERSAAAGNVTDGHVNKEDGHAASRVTERDGGNVTDGHGDDGASSRDGHGVTAGHDQTRLEEIIPDQNRLEGESNARAREGNLRAEGKWSAWRPGDPVPDFWKVMGREARRKLGMPSVDLDLEAAKFTNRHASRENPAVVNWHRVWLNWVLNPLAVEKPEAAVAVAKAPPQLRWRAHPAAAANLRRAIGDAEFEQWPGACELELVDLVAKLHAPRRLVRDIVMSRYMARVEDVLAPLTVEVLLVETDGLELPTCLKREDVEAA